MKDRWPLIHFLKYRSTVVCSFCSISRNDGPSFSSIFFCVSSVFCSISRSDGPSFSSIFFCVSSVFCSFCSISRSDGPSFSSIFFCVSSVFLLFLLHFTQRRPFFFKH